MILAKIDLFEDSLEMSCIVLEFRFRRQDFIKTLSKLHSNQKWEIQVLEVLKFTRRHLLNVSTAHVTPPFSPSHKQFLVRAVIQSHRTDVHKAKQFNSVE